MGCLIVWIFGSLSLELEPNRSSRMTRPGLTRNVSVFTEIWTNNGRTRCVRFNVDRIYGGIGVEAIVLALYTC